MRKQYLAEIQNGYCKENDWWNVAVMLSEPPEEYHRYYKTLEDAQAGIKKAVEKGQELATKKHVMGTPPFSIESAPSEKNLVTATRIRVREVSEWETI